jgi:hypothetical protein
MKNLITILLLTVANLTFSQEIPLNIVDRINDVNFIFEGRVINSEPYYSYNGGYIHTSNTVEITKILKGEIECGTIEIITQGGTIANESLEVSHSLELIEGSSGIFLCTETDRPHSIIDFYPETNLEVLEATFEGQSFIRYWWDGHEINAADVWQNYDSLAQVYNATEVISGLKFYDCQAQITEQKPKINTPIKEEKFPTYKKEDFDKLINYAKFKKDNYTRIKSSRSTDKIFYNLSNIIITGTTQKYLEFDVTVKDNLGTKYLDQSAIRLEYDPSAFGNNIVANSNIIVTRGTLNSDTNCYASPIPSDANSNTVLIPALEKVYSQCKAPILQTAQSIMHIKMKIQTCNIPNNIALVDTATFFGPSLIINYSAYANFPNDTFQTYYDLLEHNQIESVPACKATLKEFWPKQLGGGVKDTLTIHGFQFGATRGNGNLYFKNANDGGGSEVFLDSLDYISWSDTLIKIFVPSFDSAVISGTAYTGLPAGTGFFRIVTNNGEIDTSHTELKINFSVDNDSRKRVPIISPRKLFNKKITFHCSHAVANYKGGTMKSVIKKALDDWICLTGIDWELGSDTLYNDTIAKNDSICIITFARTGGNVLAQAKGWKSICPIAGQPAVYFEMDIEIDTNNLFHIDTSNIPIPSGYYDFYSIILHELGHSHNLKHVIAINDIMHYGIAPNTKKRDLENDWSCDEGGNWVIDYSTDTINNLINNCNLRNIKANPSPPCSHVSIKEIGNNLSNITLYPNPFTENLNISFNANNNEKIEIRLYDITGKLILNENYSISTGNNSINLNTINLSGGVYVINIQNSGVLQSFKLIKYGN